MSDDINELEFTIAHLNEVYKLDLTLVQFSRKQPLELLQLLNDVFTDLDKEHKSDLRDEDKAQYSQRMLTFVLSVLNYKPHDVQKFSRQLVEGDQEAIHPLLFWMMDNLDSLKKRAYIAKYLQTVEVPEEMFADDAVVQLYQEHKALQQDFKEIHRATDQTRNEKMDPQELENEINQLNDEHQQLTTKLTSLREKVEGPEFNQFDFEAVLKSTHELRKEQEEMAKLQQLLQEEKQKQLQAEQDYMMARARLRRLEDQELPRQDPRRLLTQAQETLEDSRTKCNEKLEKELRAKQKTFRELSDDLSSEPMMEDEVDHLEQDIHNLRLDVQQLEEKRDRLLQDSDGKMGFFRDRAIAVEKKRRQMGEQVQELEEEKNELEQELKGLDSSLQELVVDGEKPKTDAQMKSYMKELQGKTEIYKQKKTILMATSDEVKVLEHTEDILRSRDPNIQEFNEQQEKSAGGYQSTQEKLQDVSTAKNAVDQNKGDTLDEISRVVASITQTLRTRKTKLAPQIKELRSVRHKFEEVEKEFNKNKKIYDNCALGLNTERLGLEQELEMMTTNIMEEESSYHFMTCLSTVSDARQTQCAQELSYNVGEDKLNEKYKTYKDQYETTIADIEKLAKKLRQDKVTVGETHNDHVEQRSMFVNLRQIMDLKLKLQQDAKKQQHEEENAIMFGNGGEDRMVLE